MHGITGIPMGGWNRVGLTTLCPIQGLVILLVPFLFRNNIAHLLYARVKLTPFLITEELGTDHEQS